VQVTRLHKDGAALDAEGLVDAQVRAANPGASGVTPELIFKDSFNHIDFFAAEVAVWIELRPRSPPDHSGVLRLEF
jgi:hypothetical protein